MSFDQPFSPTDRGHRLHRRQSGPPREPSREDLLRTERLAVERKLFILTLRENPRGRFLRITEEVHGRRDTIIIPASGLEEFHRALGEMVHCAAQMPEEVSRPDDEQQPDEREIE